MIRPLGPFNPNGPSYGPRKPNKPEAPNEFWSRVHCEKCGVHFHVSVIRDDSEIVYDSDMESYEKALEAWNSRK